ncbi:MAG: beta-propeller fold lactonase family protein [Schlesneria sp.]
MIDFVQSVRQWKLRSLAVLIAVMAFTAGVQEVKAQPSTWSAVFTTTNDPAGNALAVFHPTANGGLSAPSFFPTGGKGSSTGLESQGALALSHDRQYLYAVNAGSNSITVFHLSVNGPVSVQVIASGGYRPISLTLFGNVLYVLNAGGAIPGETDCIYGFMIKIDGTLTALKNSKAYLSAASTGPAQIGFSANGHVLTVTEKSTNFITLFALDKNALPVAQSFVRSNGITPFGFAYSSQDVLVVTEAVVGATGASSVSSYELDAFQGFLYTASHSIKTGQSAACWTTITDNNHFAYVTNTSSNTITGFKIESNGTLTTLGKNGVSATTGSRPFDVITFGNKMLYVLNGGEGSVGEYTIGVDGSLTSISVAHGLPATHPVGLVVR